jgi:protein-L-isoaspartate O-methyltransferase
MNWIPHATALADQIVPATSQWWNAIASVPRHEFVPRWWIRTTDSFDGSRWRLEDGAADDMTRLETTYADRPLVTQVGRLHADHALRGDRPVGVALSCSSRPRHLIRMFQHAYLSDDADVLHIGTGSGYGCALLASRLGDSHVTSVDIDEHLIRAASERLAAINLHPRLLTLDATRPLPGTFDRIIAAVAVGPIPVTSLDALRPGGRLVTTIAGTALILTADKTPDGGAVGQIEWNPATFMTARTGSGLPARIASAYDRLRDDGGERISKGCYPVIDLMNTHGLRSMLGVTAPDAA